MSDYKRDFIELALDVGALRFGEFRLKSGRISPYFFNCGLFNSGRSAAALGRAYAAAIQDAKLEIDLLFGPAYKGIPLAALTAAALADHHQRDLPYCFNRKEVKAHGEGGNIVGAKLQGRVLIIDDVITAGTAIRESMDLLDQAAAQAAGVLVAMDRQERGQGKKSAMQEVAETYQVPVISIIRLDELIAHISQVTEYKRFLSSMENYREQYGI